MTGRKNEGPAESAAIRVSIQWSAVSQGDLGLKAGIREPGGKLTFRPILGWVTVTERKVGTEEVSNQIHPLLLNEVGYPTLGKFVQGCVGVFPKEMSDAEAVEFSRRWTEQTEASQAAINVMAN